MKEEEIDKQKISLNEATQIEQRLHALKEGISDPLLADSIKHIIDAFENKKTAIADIAYRDTETGLFNDIYFTGRLREEVNRAQRYNRDLSLMIIELGECFSETYRETAGAISETLRRSDTCARIKPGILAALLPETRSAQSKRVAEKLLNNIQPFSSSTRVEVWVGIADLDTIRNNSQKLESGAYQSLDTAKKQHVPIYAAGYVREK